MEYLDCSKPLRPPHGRLSFKGVGRWGASVGVFGTSADIDWRAGNFYGSYLHLPAVISPANSDYWNGPSNTSVWGTATLR